MVVIVTRDGELKIPKGGKISINSIGDVSIYGFRDDKDKELERWSCLCIAKSEFVLYTMLEGEVEHVLKPNGEVKKTAARQR